MPVLAGGLGDRPGRRSERPCRPLWTQDGPDGGSPEGFPAIGPRSSGGTQVPPLANRTAYLPNSRRGFSWSISRATSSARSVDQPRPRIASSARVSASTLRKVLNFGRTNSSL
jgi:hypothetical protein